MTAAETAEVLALARKHGVRLPTYDHAANPQLFRAYADRVLLVNSRWRNTFSPRGSVAAILELIADANRYAGGTT